MVCLSSAVYVTIGADAPGSIIEYWGNTGIHYGHCGITLDGAPVLGETIHMQDDGKAHEAVFPPRETAGDGEKIANDNIPQIFLR